MPDRATTAKNATAYAVSKWGVVGLTKQAAIEGIEHGTRDNAIAPGGCLGEPEEMREIVVFLLSDEASYINAAVITGDIGASAF